MCGRSPDSNTTSSIRLLSPRGSPHDEAHLSARARLRVSLRVTQSAIVISEERTTQKQRILRAMACVSLWGWCSGWHNVCVHGFRNGGCAVPNSTRQGHGARWPQLTSLGFALRGTNHTNQGRRYGNRMRLLYQGWSFRECGTCACMPENPRGAAIPRRAAVRYYPTTLDGGLVWVWVWHGMEMRKKRTPHCCASRKQCLMEPHCCVRALMGTISAARVASVSREHHGTCAPLLRTSLNESWVRQKGWWEWESCATGNVKWQRNGENGWMNGVMHWLRRRRNREELSRQTENGWWMRNTHTHTHTPSILQTVWQRRGRQSWGRIDRCVVERFRYASCCWCNSDGAGKQLGDLTNALVGTLCMGWVEERG